jgi:pimeloyl-[acyl-carrier protein] methyl ester esterase
VKDTLPALVLLHGWGVNRCVWNHLVQPLSRHFRVHAPDLPGFGGTPAMDAYSLPLLADYMLDRVPSRACWLGWSLGGQVALQAALQAPQRVQRLVLVSATPCFMRSADWPHGLAVDDMRQFCAGLDADYAAALVRIFLLQASRLDASSRTLARRIAAVVAACGGATRAALFGCLDVLEATDLRGRLAQASAPTLIIHGDQDRLTPPQAGVYLADALSAARLVMLRAGHAPFLSQPDQFLDALLAE